jgi:alkanesulfonate monooxygenase SsuD/methylene tetrahydromethanopterin reductase-like flavin-dependent oxidoreductase (luciferase family)
MSSRNLATHRLASTAIVDESTLRFGFANFLERDDAAALEAAGADSLWVGGHVVAPLGAIETMVGLSRLAALTEGVTIGTSIVIAPLIPPVLLAKQFADIDHWAGGRVVAGLGVGGDYPGEFDACQVPLSERGPRTDEAMSLLRLLWSGREIDFDGRFTKLHGTQLRPGPRRESGPPLVVAGRRPPAMRRAARLGDGWMPYLYSPERYARSAETIRTEAAAAGRSLEHFTWYAYINVCLDRDSDAARQQAARQLGRSFRGVPGQDFAPLVSRVAVAGDHKQVIEGILAFARAGAGHFIVQVLNQDRTATARRLLDEVVPEAVARYRDGT